ncbi:hypothetical protein [Halocola ammonii]
MQKPQCRPAGTFLEYRLTPLPICRSSGAVIEVLDDDSATLDYDARGIEYL